jgi:CheY-like chemotaxis protein
MPSQKRILIVEDHEDLRFILTTQLQRLGPFTILEATNGQEALALLAQEAVDLIFMNLQLPVLDGWETTRRIRALPRPVGDVPIIAFTAYALPGDETKALTAGCDDYLTKPVLDLSVMKQKVDRLLASGRPRQP